MPVAPHPIEVTVYDTDNSTLLADAKVYVRNATKKTVSSTETTDSDGVAMIDLANLPLADGETLQYETSDVIFIIAYDGNNHDGVRYVVSGSEKEQTLYLNPIPHEKSPDDYTIVNLMAFLGGNTAASVAYCKVYDIADGELIAHLEVPANDSRGHTLGRWGKRSQQGFIFEREANTLIMTASFK